MSARGSSRNARTAAALGLVIAGMVGLSFAAVPLYDWFCRVTGYGGTTSVAESAPETASERTITVRFNADVARDFPWDFAPAERRVEVRLGEQGLTHYVARNIGSEATVGMATYNVSPAEAGRYFNKIDCFCFTEQHLAAGQDVEMPVTFFVDPAIMENDYLRNAEEITLSYTFFKKEGVEPNPTPDAAPQDTVAEVAGESESAR